MILSLFKQSGVYFFGLTFSKLLSVVVFILFARQLLPARFGDFVLFVTLLQIVTFLGDFGLNQWYQKRADADDKTLLFNKIISARTFSLIVSLILSTFFLMLTHTFNFIISVIFLLTLIPEAFLSVLDGYYLEKQESIKVSLKVSSKMAILFIGYLIAGKEFTFNNAIYFYLVSSMITLGWFIPWDRFKKFSLMRMSEIAQTLRSSSSYAFLIFSSFLYARGDSLVIKYVINSTALGIYGSAYRYLESLSLLPTAISHNLFPISAKKEGISFNQLIKIIIVTFLSGLLISGIVFMFSNFLIITLLGNSYQQAIPVLKIFSLVLLLFFINAPLSTVVQSSKYINSFLPYGFGNTMLNIFLNLIFVSHYGIIAAAWVMLTTEITGFFINLYFVKKIY